MPTTCRPKTLRQPARPQATSNRQARAPRKRPIRPSLTISARTSPPLPPRADWTPWWGASAKRSAWCKSSAAARRTTRFSSAIPAWARARSWKASRNASPAAKPRACSQESASWRSTWRPSWPARSIADNLKNVCASSSKNSKNTMKSFFSSMRYTRLSVPVLRQAVSMPPIS